MVQSNKGGSDTKGILQPTCTMIWLSIFICLCLIGQSAANSDPLDRVREFHSDFINHVQGSEPFREPGFEIFPPNSIPHSSPLKEHIVMNNSNPDQQAQDVYALNTNIHRDIVFDDTQSGDPLKEGLKKNSLDIKINGRNGNGQTPSKDNSLSDSGPDAGIENTVDNSMVSKQHDGPVNYQSHSGSSGNQSLGNYMNIDVSGINVQAINTVQGGSAVATSNIEIKPVQIINCPQEVEEKLK